MSAFNRIGGSSAKTGRHARRDSATVIAPEPIQAPAKVEQLVLRRDVKRELDACEIRFEKYVSVIVARFFTAEGDETGRTNHPVAFSVADLVDHYWPRGWEVAKSRTAHDEPTEAITGVVVDQEPKPVQREGLAPVPAPSLPVPVDETQPAGPRPFMPQIGAALPARMTEWERALLGGLTHEQAAQATLDQDEAWQQRIDRLGEYFRQLDERITRGPEHYVREKTRFDLDQIMRRSAWIRQELVERPYEFGPQRRAAVLPHRVPGAFRAPIEASRAVTVR